MLLVVLLVALLFAASRIGEHDARRRHFASTTGVPLDASDTLVAYVTEELGAFGSDGWRETRISVASNDEWLATRPLGAAWLQGPAQSHNLVVDSMPQDILESNKVYHTYVGDRSYSAWVALDTRSNTMWLIEIWD